MSEHMSDSKNFEVLTVKPVRLARSPARRFRHWALDEKARIVAETFAPGANVSAIARAHELDPSQLFAWRRKALASRTMAAPAGTENGPVKFRRFEALDSEMVELVVGDIVIRVAGDVDPDRLAKIIRTVRKA